MKLRCVLLAAVLALLLAGCWAKGPVETASVPPETPATAEESAPPETPGPSLDPLEELLAQQPIDDNHDAFLVPTGGTLGTLLVTAEKGEQDRDTELGGYHTTLSVWNPRDMGEPVQTMAVLVEDVAFGRHEVVDANFDGYMDFSCMYFMGNQPNYWYLWIWDEKTGQFVEVPEYAGISSPRINPETQIIDGFARNSGAGDGVTTFHRWEDGKLVCIRRIETWWEETDMVIPETEGTVFIYGIKVEDRIDGELTQVYYKEFPQGEDFFDEQAKWERLDYHGETKHT